MDNLKLGYGGTKTEMERLLSDAEKISGVHYDISNLSDVYEAIHVIQGQLGITGTTAREAATTLEGSFNSMKAAWTDLMGNMALGNDIGPSLLAVGNTFHTWFFGNLLPMIGNVVKEIPELISAAMSNIGRSLNVVAQNADSIVDQGIEFVTSLVEGIVSGIPYLLEAAGNLIMAFVEAIADVDWGQVGEQMLDNLSSAIDQANGEIFGDTGQNIVANFVQSLLSGIGKIISTGAKFVSSFVQGIAEHIPDILQASKGILSGAAQGIASGLPGLLSGIGKAITTLLSGLGNALATALSGIGEMLGNALPGLGEGIANLMEGLANAAATVLPALS
ncbi:MAG: hypothetical protein UHU21_06530, partial [Lachnospiraceae bacterium]|nr:hypothetical protein [Lachnospiraceae bacterium]